MAIGSYQFSEIVSATNARIPGVVSTTETKELTNQAVREVFADVDLKGSKRKSPLSPNLFSNVFQYSAPSDIKDNAIIDIRRQVNRSIREKWHLVNEEYFDRHKTSTSYNISFTDDDLVRSLLIDGVEGNVKTVLHDMNSIADNGTWAVTEDASNLTKDSENFISGGASLNFDMAKGAATGVLTNSTMTPVDLTDHDEISSLFLWIFIPDYSDAQDETVTNFILRWGNDASNYWHRTVTVNNEGTTFFDGWNLLRFDWNGATEVGTVDPTDIKYAVLTVTKNTALEADTDWRVDELVSRIGDIYDVVYYTRFGWQTSSGAYLEDSANTSDLVNAETSGAQLIVQKNVQLHLENLEEWAQASRQEERYERMKRSYKVRNPSERLKLVRKYY